MKKILMLAPLVGLVAACQPAAEEEPSVTIVPLTYSCAGQDYGVIAGEGVAYIDDSEGRKTLDQIPAASGSRYAGEGYGFHMKGNEAILQLDDGEDSCTLIPFRAGGNEPFWSVSVEGRSMTLARPDFEDVVVPTASVSRTDTGWQFAASAFTLDVTDQRCDDTMADRSYPFTASVTVGGMEMTGCAGAHFNEGPL
ncbi:MliC family protein [Paracoccaceae bacterium GXU_MW_L88]